MSTVISYLLYISIGLFIATSLYYIYINLFKREIFGHIYTSLIIGVIGSIVGGKLLRQPVRFLNEYFHEFQIEIFAYVVGFLLGIIVLLILNYLMKKLFKEEIPFKFVALFIFAAVGSFLFGQYLSYSIVEINNFFNKYYIEFFAAFFGCIIILFIYIIISANIEKHE